MMCHGHIAVVPYPLYYMVLACGPIIMLVASSTTDDDDGVPYVGPYQRPLLLTLNDRQPLPPHVPLILLV